MTTITAADFAAHLRWCQLPANRGTWTRADDLVLADYIIRRGLAFTAAALRRTEAECLRRWDTLYPGDLRGIRFQEILLATLRAPAGEGVA